MGGGGEKRNEIKYVTEPTAVRSTGIKGRLVNQGGGGRLFLIT